MRNAEFLNCGTWNAAAFEAFRIGEMGSMEPTNGVNDRPGGWWSQAGTLPRLAVFLVIFAVAWYMLKELAPLLRPLLLATLLCYVILPIHKRLHRVHSATATIVIMAAGGVAIIIMLGLLIYSSALEFSDDLPRLSSRAQQITQDFQDWSDHNLPDMLSHAVKDALKVESRGAERISEVGQAILRHAADIFVEMLVVGLYVIFLLFEAKRLGRRLVTSVESEYSQRVRLTVNTINKGISNYLRAKALSSLILALPVTVAFHLFGLKFATLWGLLTFFCNYIPYVGSLIAGGGPILFAFLDLPFGPAPFAVAGMVVLWHSVSASFIEPPLLGNAVGLSPLVILLSLTFWGLCWGLVGMFLAVPLTVALKIVLSNIEATKALAAMLGDT
jgi:AI-2 transport protein TqsA